MSTELTIVETAWLRVASSGDPERFQRLVRRMETDCTAGADIGADARPHGDAVRVAAEIEAAAGVRRVLALSHPNLCRCDACHVRTRLNSSRRERA